MFSATLSIQYAVLQKRLSNITSSYIKLLKDHNDSFQLDALREEIKKTSLELGMVREQMGSQYQQENVKAS